VTKVLTKAGRELDADVVVIGVGVTPDVMLARSAGLELGQTGGIRVDSHLQTAVPGVYAAGDVAEYESVVNGGRSVLVEHWDVAFSHAKTVALNMLGKGEPHQAVPYFFSDLADWASLEYVGLAHEWDREVIRGSLDEGKFTVFYLQQDAVQAALSVGRSEDLAHARSWIAAGKQFGAGAEALADLSTDLETL